MACRSPWSGHAPGRAEATRAHQRLRQGRRGRAGHPPACSWVSNLLSTGGTAAALRKAGLPVTDVAEITGFPEIMDGRVKTLHPAIHGGLLGRRDVDAAVMREHGIGPIDLLVVNLYPFEATVSRPGCTREDAIENIDVGGPAMLRAAAKNHAFVAVLVDPADYERVLEELERERQRRHRHAPLPGPQSLRPHRDLRRGGVQLAAPGRWRRRSARRATRWD